jgi:hypothetical protein
MACRCHRIFAAVILLGGCRTLTVPTAALPDDRDPTRIRVVVPEAFELANIIMALTDYGQRDRTLIYKNTEYYQRVLNRFGAYRDRPFMRRMQLGGNDPVRRYYEFRENSAAYGFVNDRLVRGTRYGTMWSPNAFAAQLRDVQAFADTSAFRAFYRENQRYYADVVARYREIVQVDSMVAWLEREFGRRYDRYTVFFSPLIYGSHSANFQRTPLGDEVLLFVAGPDVDGGPSFSIAARAAFVQRILFTEIDHRFVNPATAEHRAEIDRIFGNRARWSADTSTFYTTPSATFNEYMTWSVFFLYLDGRLPAQDFDRVMSSTTQQMEGSRRFVRFGEFNRKMLELWRNRSPGTRAVDLYPGILEWARPPRHSPHG